MFNLRLKEKLMTVEIVDHKERIRIPVIFFAIYISLNLYQVEGVGTVVAFALLMMIIISSFASGMVNFRSFKMPGESKLLFLFLLYSSMIMFMRTGLQDVYLKYAAQIILCIIMFNFSINSREYSFIKNVFLVITVLFSIEAIRYCVTNAATRYYHGRIGILGVLFDPNFVGIPFIAASIILLDNVLRGKRRALSIVGLLIIYVTIVYSASRGNFLSLFISNALVAINYLRDSKTKSWRKIGVFLIGCVAAYFLITYFANNFVSAWQRMTSINLDNDNGRFLLWEYSLKLFQEHPIFGNGIRAMYISFGKASHNTYLQLLVEDGAIGFIIFICFWIRMAVKSIRKDYLIGIILICLSIQVFFLDALDSRCVWGLMCWAAMLIGDKTTNDKVSETSYKVIV